MRWFDRARETADRMVELFADPDRGGFFTTSSDHEELIVRRKDADDHPIPSGNSAAALALLRLAALTGERSYEEHAVSVFRLLGGAAMRHPQALAHLLRGIDFHLAAVKEVALVAAGGEDGFGELATAVRGRFRPHLVLAGGTEDIERPELMAGRAAARRTRRCLRLRGLRLPAAGRRARRTCRAARRRGRISSGSMAATKTAAKTKPQSAKQVATAYFDAIRKQDVDAMAALWKPGSTDHFYGMADLRVPEDLKQWFGNLFRAFPDFEMVVEDMVAYGDKAAVRWSATGTFTGEGKFEGLTATGARVELEGLDLLTIKDGKIVENRAYTNAMEMARQMGAMPPAGSIGEKAMFGAVNARTAGLGFDQARSRPRLGSRCRPHPLLRTRRMASMPSVSCGCGAGSEHQSR